MNITRTVYDSDPRGAIQPPNNLAEFVTFFQNILNYIPVEFRRDAKIDHWGRYDGVAIYTVTYEAPETPAEEARRLRMEEAGRQHDADELIRLRKWLKDPANIKTEEAKHWK